MLMLGLSPRRALILFATLLMVALTLRLGFWQLDRAAQKAALQASELQRAELPPLPQQALASRDDEVAQQLYRRVALRGHWLAQHMVFLENRQVEGRPGFVVVTPLRLSSGGVVLVQRGWAPRNFVDRTALPQVPTPDSEVEVLGRVAPPPGKLFELGQTSAGSIRQNLDLAAFSAEIGLDLKPVSIQQLGDVAAAVAANAGAAPSSPGDGLLRSWPRPAANISKNHGYALQWFALSALTAGLYVWFQLINPPKQR